MKNSCRTSIVVPTGQPTGTTGLDHAADHLQLGPRLLVRGAAPQPQPADLGDRRQGFAAEAQRMHAEQVVGVGDLTGGVAGHGQQQLLGPNPAPVIRHPDQLAAAVLDPHLDPACAGVHRVFQQLLDNARRPLDHFAGGDLVHDAGRQSLDVRQETPPG